MSLDWDAIRTRPTAKRKIYEHDMATSAWLAQRHWRSHERWNLVFKVSMGIMASILILILGVVMHDIVRSLSRAAASASSQKTIIEMKAPVGHWDVSSRDVNVSWWHEGGDGECTWRVK